MQLLDTLTVQSAHGQHRIELYEGDLSQMPPEQAVDLLIVSAYPDHYTTDNPNSLISALARHQLSVATLAQDKAADLRPSFACWLSQPIITTDPGIQFQRILCFEPPRRQNPLDLVGDVFQSVIPFVHGDPHIQSIALPVLAAGEQKANPLLMLAALVEAAANWLKNGLPVQQVKIVEIDPVRAADLQALFAILRRAYESAGVAALPPERTYSYDLFISYSRRNEAEAQFLYTELLRLRPTLRIFWDRRELTTGAAWQQELYDALDNCRKVLPLLSPYYLDSKVCKEEYNIAMLRHRDTPAGVLIPLYLYSAALPSYMKLIQFLDCREGDRARMTAVCADILAELDS